MDNIGYKGKVSLTNVTCIRQSGSSIGNLLLNFIVFYPDSYIYSSLKICCVLLKEWGENFSQTRE